MSFLIVPCYISTHISVRKDDRGRMDFSISKNWNIEVDQSRKDGDDISLTGHLVLDTDLFAILGHEKTFRFLLPDEINSVICDAMGHPKAGDGYCWCLEFNVSGFEKEWLIANNPGLIEKNLGSKIDERYFVVSDDYVPSRFVNLE